ncbi:hypothetical protein HDU77_009696 [Chytriomyces hyalinus]|nr:hypothetical protein HDU77_009696 [Chytriomyces hyalinus]
MFNSALLALPTVWILASLVQAQGLLTPGATPPAGFKFELGIWFADYGTPGSFNKEFGRNFASFQAAQSIPYGVENGKVIHGPEEQENQVLAAQRLDNVPSSWDDSTNASVFMTIYADYLAPNGSRGLEFVSDVAITRLATRLDSYRSTGRDVYMRWLPEMNGEWMLYGKQPQQYVETWRRMHAIFKRLAPKVQIVWSPNFDLPVADRSYWPGVEYVDIVGTSTYWKGFGYNSAIAVDYVASEIANVYNTYAKANNLPFIISEASGAWEQGPGRSPITGATFNATIDNVTQAELQRSFWAGILNPSFFAAFPLCRAAYIFEVAKQEEFFTDFRVLNNTAVASAFKGVVDAVDSAGYMRWATPVSKTSSATSTAVATSAATSSAVASVVSTTTTSSKSAAHTHLASAGMLGFVAALMMTIF